MSAIQSLSRIEARFLPAMPVAAAILVILGAKLLLIQRFGADVPFWDQWDAEGAFLYKPYLEGTLSWADLFAAHNEHRIFWTRLLSLGLLELNGLWSPRLQMVTNAFLHAAVLGLMLTWFSRGLTKGQTLFLTALTAVIYAIPLGWANTLAGFQSQFYFVFGFSLGAVWAFSTAGPFTFRWFAGFALAVAAYFSMASGAFSLVAVIALVGLQITLDVRSRTVREFSALLVLVIAAAVMLAAVPVHPGHESLKAQNLGEFLSAFLQIASWPLKKSVIGLLVFNFPVAVLFVKTLMERRPLNDPAWIAIGAMLWLGTQWVSLAYGRADGPTAPRYLDTLAIGIIINTFAGLILLCSGAMRLAGFWFIVGLPLFATSVVTTAAPRAFHAAEMRSESYRRQTANLTAYFKSGDVAHLQKKPRSEIPYPDSTRLAQLAADHSIRRTLDWRITGAKGPSLFPSRSVTNAARKAWMAVLRSGSLLLFIGFALFGFYGLRSPDHRV